MARLARHLRLLVPAVIVALAVASGAYGASNVTLSGGVATFTAGAGEVNSLTVSVASPNVVFEGVQTITESSPSCASLTTTIVTCTDSAVTSIVVDLRDQNDTLAVESTGDNPITSADTGDDAIVLGTSSTPILVEAITSAVSLEGGTGADSLTVRDTGDSSDDILTISSTAIGAGTFDSFFGGGGSATHVNVESISINAGGGDSSVSILGTSAGTTTTFDAGPGNDVIVVSSTGTASTGDLDGVLGALSILGGAGSNTLSISDADAGSGNVATVGATLIDGLAPVSVSYSATGTWAGGLAIRGSDRDDTFSLTATAAGAITDIRTLGGDDTILISSDGTGASGGLAAFGGGVALDAGAGANTIAISDQAETTPGSNAAVIVSATAITGLAGAAGASSIALAASGGTIAGLTIVGSNSAGVSEQFTVTGVPGPLVLRLGAGADTATLQSTGHASTLDAGDGDDTLTLGSPAAGLGDITAAIVVAAGNGSDSLTLDDVADPSADIVALGAGAVSTEPGNSLFGTGGALTHSGLESLALNLGSGNDAVTISATAPGISTTIAGGAGDDIVSVSGAGANLDSILSPLSLDGGLGFNILLLDDSADLTGDVATMTPTGIGQGKGDTLFGPGGSLADSSFTLLTLTLGLGDDILTLSGSSAGTLVMGEGDDVLALADQAALSGTIDGGSGNDTVSYADVRSPVSVNLDIGAAHGTSGLQSFENVTGGSTSDELRGLSGQRSVLIGGGGNDSLSAGSANDVLDGEAGNDILDGGRENDRYRLGEGRDRVIDLGGKDTADFSAARKGVKIDLSKTGKKQQRLGKGVGRLRLQAAIENVIGSKFKDRIVGNALRNVLKGGGGADALSGAAGNDVLVGGAGVDRDRRGGRQTFQADAEKTHRTGDRRAPQHRARDDRRRTEREQAERSDLQGARDPARRSRRRHDHRWPRGRSAARRGRERRHHRWSGQGSARRRPRRRPAVRQGWVARHRRCR